jgi:hypothetical protein
VLGAQHGQGGCGLLGDVAAAGALERGTDLGEGQLGCGGRVGGFGQQLQGVGGIEILERLLSGGKVLPQRVPQALGCGECVPGSLSCAPA